MIDQQQESSLSRFPLAAEDVFRVAPPPAFPRPGFGGLLWLQADPERDNRQGLYWQDPAGQAEARLLSDPGLDIRSRVHEYGGLAYACSAEAVYFCHHEDQRIYRQGISRARPEGQVMPLTPESGGRLRYGDLLHDAGHQRLLAVREEHAEQGEVRNSLVALACGTGATSAPAREDEAVEVLFDRSDFVSSPCLSSDGEWLACQAWNHPAMPWDNTSLWLTRLDPAGRPRQWCCLAGAGSESPWQWGSLVQPRFGPDGGLYFLADWSGWWNLYRFRAEELDRGGEPEALCPVRAECCAPQWQLGARHYDFLGHDHVLLSLAREGQWELARLHLSTGHLEPLLSGLGHLDQLLVTGNRLCYLAGTPGQAVSLQMLDLADQRPPRVLHAGTTGLPLPGSAISRPRHIRYETPEGVAYGLFYPAMQAVKVGEPERPPPLLVFVHGGPTSSARAVINPVLQFWTSHGFAVLDVNHRGSSGYGRAFRRSLYGEWGVADVMDVIAGVDHLVAEGLVDGERVAIRGGSAGGYVVLAALARSRVFSAGTSYYGISDLSLLVRETHKFESRYLDQLIGPYPEAEERYRQRSPLYRIHQIQAPVLLLQGLQDKVVPPNQAQAMYDQLKSRHPASRYVSFPDEGHGFRKPVNQVAALKAEWTFYRTVMGLE